MWSPLDDVWYCSTTYWPLCSHAGPLAGPTARFWLQTGPTLILEVPAHYWLENQLIINLALWWSYLPLPVYTRCVTFVLSHAVTICQNWTLLVKDWRTRFLVTATRDVSVRLAFQGLLLVSCWGCNLIHMFLNMKNIFFCFKGLFKPFI